MLNYTTRVSEVMDAIYELEDYIPELKAYVIFLRKGKAYNDELFTEAEQITHKAMIALENEKTSLEMDYAKAQGVYLSDSMNTWNDTKKDMSDDCYKFMSSANVLIQDLTITRAQLITKHNPHITDDEIKGFANETLTDERMNIVDNHVANCEECHYKYKQM